MVVPELVAAEDSRRQRSASRSVFNAHTPYAELERQHDALRDGLCRLRAALKGPVAREAGNLRVLVEFVRERLSVQFAFEERMGIMHYLHAVRPSIEPRIARLRAEHREMLATLDRSAAILRSGRAEPDVGSAVLSLLERFDRHELDERQLLRSVLLRPDPPRVPRS